MSKLTVEQVAKRFGVSVASLARHYEYAADDMRDIAARASISPNGKHRNYTEAHALELADDMAKRAANARAA
jgi:phosphate uptake regulator